MYIYIYVKHFAFASNIISCACVLADASETHSPCQKAVRWGQIAWLPASLEGQTLVFGRPGVRAQNVMQQTPSERIVSHACVRDAGHLRQLFSEYVDIYI